eukprot:CAMPEP_0197632550 /NCGR_PEP_ID=MMETSP1338-20131121/9242_1 /TAXON_ID=43686 ORGANISM="Pelagodinium beii, Strain RCC1491" /NCGR_SAMPLE_ID=MMETSP1338 /ASSEMBLY_ACC=CAM_ASM_000754 /LENGTH=803 /DNA_ID=CAMNT_0043204113 /DNA_START=377 /DNA_END=2788 /DNA_ORIENTATION=+
MDPEMPGAHVDVDGKRCSVPCENLSPKGYVPYDLADRYVKVGDEVDAWVRHITSQGNVFLALFDVSTLRPQSSFTEGDCVKGTVVHIYPDIPGALVDVGSVRPALLPFHSMSNQRRALTPEQLQVGQEIKAWIRDTSETGKLFLSLDDVTSMRQASSFTVGEHVRGTVVRIDESVPGAMVDIGAAKDGLVPLASDARSSFNQDLVGFDVDVWIRDITEKGGIYLAPFDVSTLRTASSFKVGESLKGTLVHVDPETSCALVDIGAIRPCRLSLKSRVSQKVGSVLDVWVRHVGETGEIDISLRPVNDFTVGSRLRATVVNIDPELPGVVVRVVGTDTKCYMPCENLDPKCYVSYALVPNYIKMGDEVDVWVRFVTSKGRVFVALFDVNTLRDQSSFTAGECVQGTVIHIDPDIPGALVDVGTLRPGLLPFACISKQGRVFAKMMIDQLQVGAVLLVWIRQTSEKGKMFLSLDDVTLMRQPSTFKVGEQVVGTVVRIDPSIPGALVDIGAIKMGLVPLTSDSSASWNQDLVGFEVDVWVRDIAEDGQIYLASFDVNTLRPSSSFRVGDALTGSAVRIDSDQSFLVDIGAARPARMLQSHCHCSPKQNGSFLQVWVESINEHGDIFVTSTRPASSFRVGERLTGTVVRLGECCATVDTGNRFCKLFGSSMSREAVTEITDFVQKGLELDVWVSGVCHGEVNVALFDTAQLRSVDSFTFGEQIRGKVILVRKQVAFVDVGATTAATVNLSKSARSLEHSVAPGQDVDVWITSRPGHDNVTALTVSLTDVVSKVQSWEDKLESLLDDD